MFPLVHCDVDFRKARRMGDNLDLALILTGLGRSSIRYTIVGSDRGEEILRGEFVTCVASKEMGRSVPIPDYIRAPMADYLALCQGLDAPGAWMTPGVPVARLPARTQTVPGDMDA